MSDLTIDLRAVDAFMVRHGRLLDRRRLGLLLGNAARQQVLAALAAYRNPDGGYGSGIEPDLRAVDSYPVGALHAFEVFEEILPATTPAASELCDWLSTVTLPDGGLPFAGTIEDRTGSAPWWTDADSSVSSLHMTCCIAAIAHRVARGDPAVRDHPWLERATQYCLRTIAARREPEHAMELRYALNLLDAIKHTVPRTESELARLARFIPASGVVAVEGGTDDEAMRALDFAPTPDSALRAFLAPDVIGRELDRLIAERQPDGGWRPDWAAFSPAAELEWRGWVTVRAMSLLSANGRLPAAPMIEPR
jgi:hypothetical protein